VSQLTSATEGRHYRDDGPLLDALGTALSGRNRDRAALPLSTSALLPLVVLLVVPSDQAPAALAVALSLAVLANAQITRTEHGAPFDWLVPPLLRLAEYSALLRLTALVAPDAVPACYALLAAVAYHHYDVVYRLRDRNELPPRWLRWLGLGWEGRLLAAALLAHLGVLAPGLIIAAVVLGAVYVIDGVVGWLRSGRHAAADAGVEEAEV
jgi:hypothetical protein